MSREVPASTWPPGPVPGMAGCLTLRRRPGQSKSGSAPLHGEDLAEATPGAAQGAAGRNGMLTSGMLVNHRSE